MSFQIVYVWWYKYILKYHSGQQQQELSLRQMEVYGQSGSNKTKWGCSIELKDYFLTKNWMHLLFDRYARFAIGVQFNSSKEEEVELISRNNDSFI